jgi:hypothetical protein
VIYEQEKQHAAPVDTILGHWKYKPKSGAGLVIVAALKKFGLLTDSGSGATRTAKLTDLALDILLAPPDSDERRAAIRKAALGPNIHRELLARYPNGLPSDENMRYHLVRERGFTEGGASDLIRELRATLEFAGVTSEADTVSRQEEDTTPVEENAGMSATQERHRQDPPPPPPPRGEELTIPVLLTGGRARVRLQGTFPVSQEEWDRMIALLDAHKPGLVAPDDA